MNNKRRFSARQACRANSTELEHGLLWSRIQNRYYLFYDHLTAIVRYYMYTSTGALGILYLEGMVAVST